jgi:hypothetical protein
MASESVSANGRNSSRAVCRVGVGSGMFVRPDVRSQAEDEVPTSLAITWIVTALPKGNGMRTGAPKNRHATTSAHDGMGARGA